MKVSCRPRKQWVVFTVGVFTVSMFFNFSRIHPGELNNRAVVPLLPRKLRVSDEELTKANVSSSCEPRQHIAMVKTHKCGSNLMTSIILRFVEKHDLEMLLPPHGGTNLKIIHNGTLNIPIPSRKKSKRFDAMALHTIYNYEAWSSLMEQPFDLIGLVREPLAQFKSFFNYYKFTRTLQYKFNVPEEETLDFFLDNFHNLSGMEKTTASLKNLMLFDFGAGELSSPLEFNAYIDQIMQNFTVIIVQDYFEESIVVLKNVLCWDWSDIFFERKNKGHYVFDNQNEELNKRRREKHKKLSPFDYVLFKKSLEKLKGQIDSIRNFDEQLSEFRKMNQQVTQWCSSSSEISTTLKLPVEFDSSFVEFPKAVCGKLRMSTPQYVRSHLESLEARGKTYT